MYHFIVTEQTTGKEILNTDRNKYAVFSFDQEGNIDYFLLEYLFPSKKINIYTNKNYDIQINKDDEQSLEKLTKGKKFELIETIKGTEGTIQINFGKKRRRL